MIVRCDDCGVRYDDAERWAFCPHHPIGTPPKGYCGRHDYYRPCPLCGPSGHSAQKPAEK